MNGIERKRLVRPNDLENDLSSITCQMYVRSHPGLLFEPYETTWKDRWDAFRAGRIYASLHALFPGKYRKPEDGERGNTNRDYLEDQLNEASDIRNFPTFVLGKIVGKRFPITSRLTTN